MAIINAAQAAVKTVADPNAAYESLAKIWEKCRAICNGERFAKDYDNGIDLTFQNNLLIPFSPSMTPAQYNFFKAEAELPGIVAQFSRTIVSSLLRKSPSFSFNDPNFPKEIYDWIMNDFSKDGSSLISFLDNALWEEIQTSRAWILVDYPYIAEELSDEDKLRYKPYPVLYKAENVINWTMGESENGQTILKRLIIRVREEEFTQNNEFHPEIFETVYVHEIHEGYYRIRKFRKDVFESNVPVIAGQEHVDVLSQKGLLFKEIETNDNILFHGERLTFIPAWPLNGTVETKLPVLLPLIDKEVSLYNKLSRRNHLLYGASTYTPYIVGDLSSEDFESIVSSGLGSWLHLPNGSEIGVLETPTSALADMDRVIVTTIEEMAKLGVRMMAPEVMQPGIALEIRNAAHAAQLGSLNSKVSATMKQVIAFMIEWRLDLELNSDDIKFSLSSDFNPMYSDAGWLRLVTEWYQQGLVPRSIWVAILKSNEMLPSDYDDIKGREEITADVENQLDSSKNDEDVVDI